MAHPIYELAAAENAAALEEIKRVAPGAYAIFVRSRKTMDEYRDAAEMPKSATRTTTLTGAFGNAVPPATGALGSTVIVQHPSSQPVTQPESVWGFAKRASEAARVREGAKKWLAAQNGRRTSGEITKALIEAGVEVAGVDFQSKAMRVSSHLSVSPEFDNDRERGGYQIAGWKDNAFA